MPQVTETLHLFTATFYEGWGKGHKEVVFWCMGGLECWWEYNGVAWAERGFDSRYSGESSGYHAACGRGGASHSCWSVGSHHSILQKVNCVVIEAIMRSSSASSALPWTGELVCNWWSCCGVLCFWIGDQSTDNFPMICPLLWKLGSACASFTPLFRIWWINGSLFECKSCNVGWVLYTSNCVIVFIYLLIKFYTFIPLHRWQFVRKKTVAFGWMWTIQNYDGDK